MVTLIETNRALLEVIATKLATNHDSVNAYVRRTLLCQLMDKEELAELVESTLQNLVDDCLIETSDSAFEATTLGRAIVASSLTPEDGLFVHEELRKALKAFVMDGDMHALYSFTPVQAAQADINWQIFRREVESFDDSNLRALDLVGLKLSVINKM